MFVYLVFMCLSSSVGFKGNRFHYSAYLLIFSRARKTQMLDVRVSLLRSSLGRVLLVPCVPCFGAELAVRNKLPQSVSGPG